VTILLKEYDTLRDEVIATISTRATILSFGFGAQAALVGAASLAAVDGTSEALLLLTCYAIPGASVVVLALWLAEYSRMTRAGEALLELEQGINRIMGATGEDRLLTWEIRRWETARMRAQRSRHKVASDQRRYFDVLAWADLLMDSVAVVVISFAAFTVIAPIGGSAVADDDTYRDVSIAVFGSLALLQVGWFWAVRQQLRMIAAGSSGNSSEAKPSDEAASTDDVGNETEPTDDAANGPSHPR
jgi:hypothetical protein